MKKITGFIIKKVVPIIVILAFLVMLVFPFLNNVIHPIVGLISIICCSLIVLFVSVVTEENKLFNIVTSLLFIYIFCGIFVINYFNTDFNYWWFAFILVFLIVPYLVYIIYLYSPKKYKITDLQKKTFIANSIKYIFFYYILNIFYLSFLIDNITCRYVFGGLAILMIFYYSMKGFVVNIKPSIAFIVQDVIVGTGLTIYLISIIPDESVQTIVTSVISALFGGYVTLLGVAWTIKDNNKNRKEDEKRSKTPYLYVNNDNSKNNYFHKFMPDCEKQYYDENLYEQASLENVNIKNSSNSECILLGISVNCSTRNFENAYFLEKGGSIRIDFSFFNIKTKIENKPEVCLLVKDVLGNKYRFDCHLKDNGVYELNGKPHKRYSIASISLPIEDNS